KAVSATTYRRGSRRGTPLTQYCNTRWKSACEHRDGRHDVEPDADDHGPISTSIPSRRSLPSSHASTRAVTSTTPSTWISAITSESRCSAARSRPSPTGTRICATGRSAWAEVRSTERSSSTPPQRETRNALKDSLSVAEGGTDEVRTACG